MSCPDTSMNFIQEMYTVNALHTSSIVTDASKCTRILYSAKEQTVTASSELYCKLSSITASLEEMIHYDAFNGIHAEIDRMNAKQSNEKLSIDVLLSYSYSIVQCYSCQPWSWWCSGWNLMKKLWIQRLTYKKNNGNQTSTLYSSWVSSFVSLYQLSANCNVPSRKLEIARCNSGVPGVPFPSVKHRPSWLPTAVRKAGRWLAGSDWCPHS